MAQPSPVAVALHSAFDQEFLPLLKQLGFEPTKVKRVKPGLVVASAARSLGGARRLQATLWCDGARGSQLRFRFDVVGPINGVECTEQVDLKVPWPDKSAPRPPSLDFSGNEFLPQESPERLSIAIRFLAGAFAASLERVDRVPEISAELNAAKATSEWKAAAERARGLWETRHVRG